MLIESKHVVTGGCYLIRYVPVEPLDDVLFFEGTARVMRVGSFGQRDPQDGQIKAGADLYARLRKNPNFSFMDPKEWADLNPAQVQTGAEDFIPIFPRALYRYYLKIAKILENVPAEGSVSISFSIHEFRQDREWPNPGSRWVCLQQIPRPAEEGETAPPATQHRPYYEGNVVDQDSGQIVGTLTLCRISQYLRRAKVAIHGVKGVQTFPGAKEKSNKQEAQDAWTKAFEQTGWELEVETNPEDLADPEDPNGEWTIGELQQALYALRIKAMAALQKKKKGGKIDDDDLAAKITSAVKELKKPLEKMTQLEILEFIPGLATLEDPLDEEWAYELLCVQTIKDFDRGVMFDTYGSDSENLPREGAAVAAEWKFGDDAKALRAAFKERDNPEEDGPPAEQTAEADEIELRWGAAKNHQLQTQDTAYFRVGVHEIGHSMGLDHNFKDHGFMNTTDTIAEDDLAAQQKAIEAQIQSVGVPPQQLQEAEHFLVVPKGLKPVAAFPDFIRLHFQADDLNRLRFGADVAIRPGTSFQDFGPLFGDVKPTPADGLSLEAKALLHAVPFGAPVRINVKITNTSGEPQKGPISLSLKSGVITGSVVDPHRNERYFWPLKKAEDSDPGGILAPYETRTYALTLMRGPQKALFPMVGDHLVKLTAEWSRGGKSVYLEAPPTRVRVTAPIDDNHRAAALKVMSTPDTLFSLAIIGDHLTEGNEAVEAAVANPILRPHFALIRAKLLLIGPREIHPDKACELIDDTVVMSFDEIDSLSHLLLKVCQSEKEKGKQLDVGKLQKAVLALIKKFHVLHADGSIDKARAKKVRTCLNDLDKLGQAPQSTLAVCVEPEDLSKAVAKYTKGRKSESAEYLDKIQREVAAEARVYADRRLQERLSELAPPPPPGAG